MLLFVFLFFLRSVGLRGSGFRFGSLLRLAVHGYCYCHCCYYCYDGRCLPLLFATLPFNACDLRLAIAIAAAVAFGITITTDDDDY